MYKFIYIFDVGGFPKPQNYTEYLMLNKEILAAPSKPRIVLYYKTVMENIGNTLIVPCKVIGNPRPDIYWFDSDEIPISHQHPRFKVSIIHHSLAVIFHFCSFRCKFFMNFRSCQLENSSSAVCAGQIWEVTRAWPKMPFPKTPSPLSCIQCW